MGISTRSENKESEKTHRKSSSITSGKFPKPIGRPPKKVKYIWKIIPMDYIQKVGKLDLSGSNLAENWRIFWQNYEIFFIAAELEKKSEVVKTAIFLNAIGPEGVEIFNTFNITEAEKKKYDSVVKAFTDFCKPKKNEVYEIFKFLNRKQEQGEPFDDYLLDLKKLVKACAYGELEDRMLRDRIVQGIYDTQVQKRLLENDDLTLNKTIEIVRASEATKSQMEQMTKSFSSLNFISKFSKNNPNNYNNFNFRENAVKTQLVSQNYIQNCKFCLKSHQRGNCPAYNQKCNKCGKLNHFAAACKSMVRKEQKNKQVRELISNENEVSELYIDSIDTDKSQSWYENVQIQNEIVRFKLDTGADINVLPLHLFKKLKEVKLRKENIKVQAYGGIALKPIGKFCIESKVGELGQMLDFIVLKEGNVPILGLDACIRLKLIKRIEILNTPSTKDAFLEQNKEIFEGLGKFCRNLHIDIDEKVSPTIKPARRIPYTLKEPVFNELERLEKLNIIEKCNTPSEWISNLVIVEKPNKQIRLCLDPKALNLAIKPLNHPIPTFDEISSKLAGKCIFTSLDLKDGYWQIELDERSSKLCTFSTPFGLYKFKRLPFGVKTAPEIFQASNEKNFEGIDGVVVYIDDLLIAATDECEHDRILEEVVKRAKKLNIKFNKDKVQFKVKEVKFLGHRISNKGIACDPDRMKAIEKINNPNDKKELQKILGMINYVRKYIPNLAEMSQPLRELLKKNVVFRWEQNHTECLEKIKSAIKLSPTLKSFDPLKTITIQADASKYGLGACMMQDNKPVYFISRSLSETEQYYAQIEKELLAIVFACSKLHFFIYGRPIKVITDHKPLIGVFKKEIGKIPNARLQRMMIRLAKYKIDIQHCPGKYMHIADLLSRCPNQEETGNEIIDLNCVIHSINASSEKKDKIRSETENDSVLAELKKVLTEGWPKTKEKLKENIRQFWKLRNELILNDGIIFLNDRIVVPLSMRNEILDLLHQAHLGIEKTKGRARSLVYWPGLDEAIENKISACQICQKHRASNIKDPYKAHDIPIIPFSKIAMDVCEYEKKNYLVVTDYLSKYIEILPLKNKTASEIITQLKIVFGNHGIPNKIIADNMPFGSYDFRKFAKTYDIEVITTSPHYPQSNGLAERSVRTAKMLIRTSKETKTELWYLLLEYRNSPIKGCKLSPCEILMGRKLRTQVPGKESLFTSRDAIKLHQQLQINNSNNEKYYNRQCRDHERKFEENEKVWVKNGKEWEKAEVKARHNAPRSYMIKRNDDTVVRRNSYFLRPRL